jgi:hypothetical protein
MGIGILADNGQMRLVDPKKELKIHNQFFMHQKGLEVYIEKVSAV